MLHQQIIAGNGCDNLFSAWVSPSKIRGFALRRTGGIAGCMAPSPRRVDDSTFFMEKIAHHRLFIRQHLLFYFGLEHTVVQRRSGSANVIVGSSRRRVSTYGDRSHLLRLSTRKSGSHWLNNCSYARHFRRFCFQKNRG